MSPTRVNVSSPHLALAGTSGSKTTALAPLSLLICSEVGTVTSMLMGMSISDLPLKDPALLTWLLETTSCFCSFSSCCFSSSFSSFILSLSLRSRWKSSSKIFTWRKAGLGGCLAHPEAGTAAVLSLPDPISCTKPPARASSKGVEDAELPSTAVQALCSQPHHAPRSRPTCCLSSSFWVSSSCCGTFPAGSRVPAKTGGGEAWTFRASSSAWRGRGGTQSVLEGVTSLGGRGKGV